MARRALVIAPSYRGLQGRHNNVDLISQVLAKREFAVTRCLDGDATRAGILAAYRELIEAMTTDDAAVIYYTGHGGMVRNRQYVPGSDVPPSFQHICPSDFAETTEERFLGISSLELSLYLARLTARTKNVTAIFDCCYSALMSRHPVEAAAKAIEPVVTYQGIAWYLGELRRTPDLAEIAVRGNPHAIRISASAQSEPAYRVHLPDAADLAAMGIAGIPRDPRDDLIGILTLELARVLVAAGERRISWRALTPALRAASPTLQRAEVEGPVARVPFSLDTVDAAAHAVRRDGAALVLDAGSVLGVAVGDVYGVMPCGATAISDTGLIARAVIGEVGPLESRALRVEWVRELTAHAVALPISRAAPRYAVRVSCPPDARPIVEAALARSAALRAATDTDLDALGELRVERGELEVRDALGPLGPRAPFPGALPAAVRDLGELAVAARLRALANDHGLAPDGVDVELGVVEGGRFRAIAPSGDRLGLCDRPAVRLVNRGAAIRYANVFNIDARGSIAKVVPDALGVPLQPGVSVYVGTNGDQLVGFPLEWPADLPADLPRPETVLAIVTAQPIDLGGLASAGRGERGDGGVEPPPCAFHWRDYVLVPAARA